MTIQPVRGVRAAARPVVHKVGAASAAAALFAVAAPALAEDAADAAMATAEAEGATTVSGVTVIGTRVDEESADPRIGEIVDAPQTVTVVPREIIEQRGATSLRDVLRNVTGISMQAGEGGVPNGDNLSLRGFSARTDIFVDGVRDLGGYFRDSFNLESVEVVKGPASAQAGRGSTGGIINQVSKLPHLENFVGGQAGVGDPAYGRVELDVNRALDGAVEGAALRVNLMYHDAEAAGRDLVASQRWGVAPTLALGLGTDTRMILSYYKLAQDNVPDYGIPWVPDTAAGTPLEPYIGQPAPVARETWYGLARRDYEETDTDIGTIRFEHDLSDALTVTQTFRFVSVDRDSIVTAPRFVAVGGVLTGELTSQLQSRDQVDENFTSQTSLLGRFGEGLIRHRFLLGLELVEESSINYLRAHTGAQPATTPWDDPDPYRPIPSPVRRNGGFNAADSSTTALYLFDTVEIGERFELTGGLRWDRFDLAYNQRSAAGAITRFDQSDEFTSWRVGGVWHPVKDASVYVSYGTSFNPSAEALTLSATTAGVPPEESETFEVGAKWDMLGKRLLVSTAVFRTDKTNARTPGLPGDPPTVLDGEQRVDGFEIGVTGRLTPDWTVFAGYTRLDSEIRESNTAGEVGNRLPNTPDDSFSLWSAYEIGDRFQVGAGAQYAGERFSNTANSRRAEDYWLFDAMAAWNVNAHIVARVNVYNIADEEYLDSLGGGHVVPGAGRSAVLSVSFRY